MTQGALVRPLSGVFSIVPTPFSEDGELDEASLRSVVEYFLECEVDGLFALGVASESYFLSDEERRRVVEVVVGQVAGRVPVLAGSGHPSTHVVVQQCRQYSRLGAAAVVVLPPYVTRPDADGILRHFRTVAESTQVPVVLQDEPASTGVTMPAALIARVAREVENVRYAKVEGQPVTYKLTEVKELVGEEIGLFTAGSAFFDQELSRGVAGIMTGLVLAGLLVDIWRAFNANDIEGAWRLWHRYLPLVTLESHPALLLSVRKEMLRMMGIIQTATVRPPALRADAPTIRHLESLLDVLNLRGGYQPSRESGSPSTAGPGPT